MKIDTFDSTGKKAPSLEINPKDLASKVNEPLISQAIRIIQVNNHQKTSKVKSRGEVRGSTRKIYRQKGTGRARHGDKYAPIFVGGGIAHGPRGIRPKKLTLPKKMKRKAFGSALLLKLQEKSLSGITDAAKIEPKTNKCALLLSKIANHPKNKVLIITTEHTNNLYQATKNLQGINIKKANLVNTLDIIANDHLIVTRQALKALIARTSGKTATAPDKTKTVNAATKSKKVKK